MHGLAKLPGSTRSGIFKPPGPHVFPCDGESLALVDTYLLFKLDFSPFEWGPRTAFWKFQPASLHPLWIRQRIAGFCTSSSDSLNAAAADPRSQAHVFNSSACKAEHASTADAFAKEQHDVAASGVISKSNLKSPPKIFETKLTKHTGLFISMFTIKLKDAFLYRDALRGGPVLVLLSNSQAGPGRNFSQPRAPPYSGALYEVHTVTALLCLCQQKIVYNLM